MITIEALCQASAERYLLLSDMRDISTDVVFTENGKPWARVTVKTLTDAHASVFPRYLDGSTGDDKRQGQRGVLITQAGDDATRRHALGVVLARAARMAR